MISVLGLSTSSEIRSGALRRSLSPVTNFEKYFTEKNNGSEASIKITVEQQSKLRIDGMSYQLCKGAVLKPSIKSSVGWTGPVAE
jgi:hypothetical protein